MEKHDSFYSTGENPRDTYHRVYKTYLRKEQKARADFRGDEDFDAVYSDAHKVILRL